MFFNSTQTDRRRHQASDLALYWSTLLSNGLIPYEGDVGLKVIADTSNMRINIDDGFAIIDGHLYINDNNDGERLNKTIEGAHATLNRIDRVVLRYDNTLENRYIKVFIKKGENAAEPTPPTLTRENEINELSLAQIYVAAGKSYIDQTDITDERQERELCGLSKLMSASTEAEDMLVEDVYKVFRNFNMEAVASEIALLPLNLNVYRSNLDNKGVWQTIEEKRADGTLARKTELSNPDANGNYQTQTIELYDRDGVTVLYSESWAISYDTFGNVVNEVRVNA